MFNGCCRSKGVFLDGQKAKRISGVDDDLLFSLWMDVVCEIVRAIDTVLIVEVVILSTGITGTFKGLEIRF